MFTERTFMKSFHTSFVSSKSQLNIKLVQGNSLTVKNLKKKKKKKKKLRNLHIVHVNVQKCQVELFFPQCHPYPFAKLKKTSRPSFFSHFFGRHK